MPNEETSSVPVVKINGQALAPEVAARLVSATFDDAVGVPDMLVLRFLDDGADVLERARVEIGAALVFEVQRSGSGAPTRLFTGEVTAVEVDVTPHGTRTLVRGYDVTHRFLHGRRVESFVNQTAADIVRTIAQKAGVSVGKVDAKGAVLAHVSQPGINDWALLRRLASRTGAVLAVKDGKLNFQDPTLASTSKGAAGARQSPLVLERGVNLVSLRATVTAADQVPSVQVRSWDVRKKAAIVATAPAKTSSAQLESVTPVKLATTVKAADLVDPQPAQPDHRGCTTAAEAIANRIAGTHAELEGMARGNPELRAGVAVTVLGVGNPFNGRYTLTSTRHEFDSDRGYVTTFTVSNASDRTTYGLATGVSRGDRSARLDGLVVGIVSDIKDPDKLGRVRVTVPVLSDDFVSTWARTLQPGAGVGRGTTLLPEVGDEVLVAFGLGGLDDPYVLGGLYNGKDLPSVGFDKHIDGQGKVARRAFVSRTGMVLEMLESPSEQKVTLSTNDGAQRITLVQKAQAAIEIISEGPVTVTAKKDVKVTTSGGNIALEATMGNVTMKGQNVTIEATAGTATLQGINVKLSAQASNELTGATVKVAGQATAELSAAGPTTVRGAIVRIN